MANKGRQNDNFSVIRQHLFDPDGGSIELTNEQQNALERWEAVINLKCVENFTDKDIRLKLVENFGVSPITAYSDIGNAEALFAYNNAMNKRFRMFARIQFLEEKIHTLWIAEDYETASKLEATLFKYYEAYPELKAPTRPQKLVFVYNGDKPLIEDDNTTIEEAEATLLQLIEENAG